MRGSGPGRGCKTSLCERPITAKEVLDFSEKYLHSEGGSKGMKSLDRELPAKISKEMEAEIDRLALEILRAWIWRGVVRIDFMIDNATNTLYANEVNTIPGSLHSTSTSPWASSIASSLIRWWKMP